MLLSSSAFNSDILSNEYYSHMTLSSNGHGVFESYQARSKATSPSQSYCQYHLTTETVDVVEQPRLEVFVDEENNNFAFKGKIFSGQCQSNRWFYSYF